MESVPTSPSLLATQRRSTCGRLTSWLIACMCIQAQAAGACTPHQRVLQNSPDLSKSNQLHSIGDYVFHHILSPPDVSTLTKLRHIEKMEFHALLIPPDLSSCTQQDHVEELHSRSFRYHSIYPDTSALEHWRICGAHLISRTARGCVPFKLVHSFISRTLLILICPNVRSWERTIVQNWLELLLPLNARNSLPFEWGWSTQVIIVADWANYMWDVLCKIVQVRTLPRTVLWRETWGLTDCGSQWRMYTLRSWWRCSVCGMSCCTEMWVSGNDMHLIAL